MTRTDTRKHSSKIVDGIEKAAASPMLRAVALTEDDEIIADPIEPTGGRLTVTGQTQATIRPVLHRTPFRRTSFAASRT